MPPITDPNLLAQIQQQQQGQPRTLAAPPPYYSGPPTLPSATLPTGTREGDPYAGGRFGLSTNADRRAAALAPSQASEAASNAAIAKLKLQEAQEKWDQEHPKPGTGVQGAYGPDAIKDLSVADQAIVKGLVQGRIQPPSNFALKTPYWQHIIQHAAQYDPTFDMTAFPRRVAAMKSFTSGPLGQNVIRINTALQHLNSFYEAAHAFGNAHDSFFAPVENYPRSAYLYMRNDPRYKNLDAARTAVAGELAAAFKGSNDTALASMQHWEGLLSTTQSPEAFDAAIKQIAGLLSGRIDAVTAGFKNAVGPSADAFDLINPKAKQAFDKFNADDFGLQAQEAGEKKLSTDTKAIEFPKGYQDEHKGFIDAHRGTMTVPDYIAFRKQTDEKYGVREADLDPDEVKKFVDEVNKGKPVSQLPPLGEKKLSPVASAVASFAESPAGTFTSNLTNAGTAGLVDLAVGQEGRDAKALADEENWKSALGGELVGSVVGMGGLERGSARLAEKLGVSPEMLEKALGGVGRARLATDVGVNAAYGGARGFAGADEGEGGEGFLKGVAGGTLGALGGNAVTKGLAAPLLSDTAQNALTRLKGVKLTTLQKLGLGKMEESLSGVPFAHGARQAAMRSMNVDNADRVLANIGKKVPRSIFGKSLAEPGTDLNAYVNDQINQAYGKIRPKIFGATDGQFDNAITAIQTSAATPEKQAMFSEIKDAIDQFKDPVTGLYNGDGYQSASMRLRSLIKDFSTQAENSGSTAARDMARAAEQARKQMQFQIQRTAPEVATELKGIERAYAHSMRVEDATNRALSASETGVYSPGQLLSSIKKLDTSLNKGATARGKAFDQQYAEAAAKVLGHGNVPKISVKETGVAATLLGLGTYASPHLAAFLAAAGTGLYGIGVKKATQAVLAGQRPKIADNEIVRRALSDFIRHQETGD